MHTGKKIKLLRNIKNITQEELAEKINKTRALVSHIEKTGKVNHYTLLSILKIFKLSEDEFDNFNEEKAIKKNPKEIELKLESKLLNEKIDYYQNENKLLREIIENQKEIIRSLKSKK
jgi:transcriptional regulator with XRE-family HTH domain